jgi:polygalacturonase
VQVIGVISALLIFGSLAECRVPSSSKLNNFDYPAINCRKHSAVLTDFGGVGDGKTSNTKAFNTAITKLSQYANDGGAQLIVPPGKWLTGSFNLTSHFTLFLQKGAVILGSQVYIILLMIIIFVAFGKFYSILKGHFNHTG